MSNFGLCHLSVIPLRLEASEKSEMVSQLLFGEHFSILETFESWARVSVAYDAYQGWINAQQLMKLDAKEVAALERCKWLAGLSLNQIAKSPSKCLNLLPGSVLPHFNGRQINIGQERFEFYGSAIRPNPKKISHRIEQAAAFYLGSPYLWGGKTPYGIDCSGFTQMVFKQFGIKLFRDAYQQADQGVAVTLSSVQPGDLAFFHQMGGRPTHVGILLEGDRIIHASGCVRVDRIDEKGIYCSDSKLYTHNLLFLRRFFD